MSILDPDGSLDTYRLEAGDVYFVPRAYPHQIEVVGEEDVHFLVFFDQPTPGDIGYRASASAFSRRTLASVVVGGKAGGFVYTFRTLAKGYAGSNGGSA